MLIHHSRRLLLWLVILLLIMVMVAVGFILLSNKNDSSDQSIDNAINLDQQQEITGVRYLSVEEIRSDDKYTQDDRYLLFTTYAEGNKQFKDYSSSLLYYEAAIGEAGNDNDKLQYVQYAIYLMAIESDNLELEKTYAELLGQETINNFKQKALEYDTNR